MFSRSTVLIQQVTNKNVRRSFSFQQLKDVKPLISRNLAWFSRQPVQQQTFGLYLKFIGK